MREELFVHALEPKPSVILPAYRGICDVGFSSFLIGMMIENSSLHG